MQGFRDMHLHIVYGVDDGAQSLEDMQAMLDEVHDNNVTALYCTSHQTPGMEDFPKLLYLDHVKEARAYIRDRGYDLKLFTGAEILYTPALRNIAQRRELPTMGSTSHVLVEFVPDVSFDEAEDAVTLLEDAGYLPILAHVERYRSLYGQQIFRLKERHRVRYQVNCNTIVNGAGMLRNRHLKRWFRSELIDYVSSDMHDTVRRPSRMLQAWDVLCATYGEAYAHRLMADDGNGFL